MIHLAFKGLGLVEIEDSELADYFPEMLEYKGKCKFHNCKHVNEPKCAVKSALDKGKFILFVMIVIFQ